jgi:hypothetical protein
MIEIRFVSGHDVERLAIGADATSPGWTSRV